MLNNLTIIFIIVIVLLITIFLIRSYWKNTQQDKKIVKFRKTLGTNTHDCKSHYHQLIDLYQQKIKKGKSGFRRQLADLYYSGSELGNIPSNPHLAIKWYTQAVEKDGDLMSLVYIGDIYRNGVQNEIKPDPKYAWKCYQKAIEYSGKAGEVFDLAQERLRDMEIDPPSTEAVKALVEEPTMLENFKDTNVYIPMKSTGITIPVLIDEHSIRPTTTTNNKWDNLFNGPTFQGPIAVQHQGYNGIEIEDRNLDPEILLRPLPTPPPPPPQQVEINVERADFRHPVPREVPIPRIHHANGVRGAAVRNDLPPQPPQDGIRNDPQNAHDTTLLRGARDTISKLRESTPVTIDTSIMLNKLRKHIESIGDHTRRAKAISVLDKIETNHMPMVNMHEMREVDILNLVYNRIHSPVNKGRENDLMEVLVDQLCDGHGNAGPVCATGRATRVLSSLDATDAQADQIVTMKPKWAVKQELLNNASVIRDRLMKERGPEFETLFNKPNQTPDEEKTAEEFVNTFKQTLRNEYKKEYVDPGILTQIDLDTELEKWIDHVA